MHKKQPKADPNWQELCAISNEMEQLIDAGKWNTEKWNEFVTRAIAASNGNPALVEFVVNKQPKPNK